MGDESARGELAQLLKRLPPKLGRSQKLARAAASRKTAPLAQLANDYLVGLLEATYAAEDELSGANFKDETRALELLATRARQEL